MTKKRWHDIRVNSCGSAEASRNRSCKGTQPMSTLSQRLSLRSWWDYVNTSLVCIYCTFLCSCMQLGQELCLAVACTALHTLWATVCYQSACAGLWASLLHNSEHTNTRDNHGQPICNFRDSLNAAPVFARLNGYLFLCVWLKSSQDPADTFLAMSNSWSPVLWRTLVSELPEIVTYPNWVLSVDH